jgi:hypothetical protein
MITLSPGPKVNVSQPFSTKAYVSLSAILISHIERIKLFSNLYERKKIKK